MSKNPAINGVELPLNQRQLENWPGQHVAFLVKGSNANGKVSNILHFFDEESDTVIYEKHRDVSGSVTNYRIELIRQIRDGNYIYWCHQYQYGDLFYPEESHVVITYQEIE